MSLTDEQGTPATLRRIRGGGAGLTGELLVPRGRSIDDVVRAAPALASALHVRSVEVQPNAADASKCMLRFALGEPFGDPVPWTPRAISNGRLDVGHDEDGEPVSIRLYGRSVLVGGIPGAGKSSILQGVIAAVVATPGWRLSVCDPKRVELAAWRGRADAYACDAGDALVLLDGVLDDMAARYRHMADRGLRTADPDDPATPPSVVVVDELASYTGTADRKVAKEFEQRLRELASLGRAAGISLVLATQKPSSDTVPTSIRDVIPTRWALACTSPHHSDAILGAGTAAAGHDASRLDRGRPGVGFLLDESSTPRLVRADHLDDATLARLTSGTGQP